MTADGARCESLRLVLNTWDRASERMQGSDISANGLDLLCAAEFISACSLADCPDCQMSQNPRQTDKTLQFCTDNISDGRGEKKRLFPRETWMSGNSALKGICMKCYIWIGEGQPQQNASKSEFNLKRGKVIKGKERSL